MKAEKPKRAFKGIWVPREIWLSEELSTQEKVFLAEIDSLNQGDGCYATNDYFAQFFSLSQKRVSFIISSLVKKGRVKSEINKRAGNKRRLWPIPENGDTPYPRKQGEGGPGNAETPIPENEASDNIIDNKLERKRDKEISPRELSASRDAAYLLLCHYGIGRKVAQSIVYDQHVSPETIEETIKNGLAKQKFEPGFKLEPGYIVASINGARRESKTVKPTKHSKRLKKIIEDKNRPRKRLTPEETEARKKKQIKALKET